MRHFYFLMALLFAIAQSLNAQTALYFDGVDDYIVVPGNSKLNGPNQITLETWIYSGNYATSPCADCSPIIWNQGKAYRFGVGNTKIVSFSLLNISTTVTLTSTYTLNTNTWHHIAGTYDGSKMRIYIDGVATDSLTSSIAITYASSTDDVWIADPATGWGGILEETRIWDYARSNNEIKEGMRKLYPSSTKGLVLNYGYEDGKAYANNTSVSTILDNSSNKIDGTASNFNMKDTVSNFVLGRSYCDTAVYAKVNVSQCIKYVLPSKKRTVTASGTYNDTIVSYRGCDSVMTIQVTILNPTSSNINIASCDSFRNPLSGVIYKKTGKYSSTIKNKAGCDSVVTFNVTIYKKDSSLFNYTACGSVKLRNGKTVTNSGRYVDSLKSKKGCDSLVIHNVKIKKVSYAKSNLKVCVFVICPSNKTKVFYLPGIYYDTVANSIGCDSIIEYTVVSGTSYSTINFQTCKPYKSPTGKYTYTQSGIYNDTFFYGNKVGCDSIVTINLTVDVATKKNLQVNECKHYTVPSGTKIITNSQIVTDVLKAKNGCDSIEFTIDVTINKPNIGYTKTGNTLSANSTDAFAAFRWLNCNDNYSFITGENKKQFTPGKDGRFAVEVNEKNCIDTSVCINFTLTGISKILQPQISVIPNPSNGRFIIKSSYDLHQVKVNLFDIKGSIVSHWEWSELNQTEVNVTTGAGIYYLKIESVEGTSILPLVIK